MEQRNAWCEAIWVFVLSRMAILAVTFLGAGMQPPPGQSIGRTCAISVADCVFSWWHWDTVHYVTIAYEGYSHLYLTAFFPLWPVLMHLLGIGLGGSRTADYIAGLLLSNTCFYMALVLLYKLVSKDFSPQVGRTALFYLAFSPVGLFFFAAYTESLFLLLCLAVFYCLRRGQMLDWWLAAACGGLATLTRSTGLVLVMPYLVLWCQRSWPLRTRLRQGWRSLLLTLLPILIIPLGLAVYVLYLWIFKGDPLLFSKQENLMWRRHLTWPGMGILSACIVLMHGGQFNIQDLIFTLLPIGLLSIGWKQLPWHYRLFALAMILFVLSSPTENTTPLASAPRYMLAVFPITVLCAIWGQRLRFMSIYLALTLPLFVLNIIFFASNSWVG